MSTEHSPQVISKIFIKKYYELLGSNPNDLYRFYKDDSSFTHTEGSQAAEVITGTEKIRAFVRELDIAGARFNLGEGSVDAHQGENNGVVVLVTGYCTPNGSDVARQFVQSFFLAVQAENSAAYYVRNSMFRMFEPATVTVSTGVATDAAPATVSTGVNPAIEEQAVAVEKVVAEPTAAPAREGKRSRGKKDNPPPPPPPVPEPVAEVEPVAEMASQPEPSPEPQSAMIMDSVVVLIEDGTGEAANRELAENRALHAIGEQLAELAEEIVAGKEEDAGPKSYADLFKRNKAANTIPTPAAANNNNKKVRSGSGGRTRAEPAASKAPKAEAAPVAKPAQAVQGTSLYVKQLPADITVADLLSAFPGATKADINSSKGFGFIEFPEPVFAASTLTRYQEDPAVFSVNGQQLKVEERVATKGSGPKGNNQRGSRDKAAENAGQAGGKQNKQGGNAGARKNGAKGGDKGAEKGEKGWNYKK